MRLGVCCMFFCCSVVYASIYSKFDKSGLQLKPKKIVDGMEFDKVSRGTLLKMLATFEETILRDSQKQKMRPQFTAQFANNRFTRPFIYPQVFKSTVSLNNVLPDPGCCTEVGLRQVMYALWVNMTEVLVGMAYGFTTVLIPQIGLPESSIDATVEEQSWIASILFLAAPVGCIFCGCIMDKYGRRVAMLMCKVPLFVGWFYTALASHGFHMIIGRVITGIGCGMAASPPRVYVVEITLPNMRGILSSFPPLAIAVGITISASLGAVADWHALCYVNVIFAIVLFILDTFLPETPYYLLSQHTSIVLARKSLKTIRGKKYNTEAELEDMTDFKAHNKIRKLSMFGTVKALLSLPAVKPFAIIVTYVIVAQMSGVTIMILWTVQILNDSMSSVRAEDGNVILSVTRFCSGVLLTLLLYRLPKKSIAVTSSLGVGVVCLAIFLYLMYWRQYGLFPQIAYSIYVIFATLGYNSLPFMIMSEVYPLQVRGILGGITMSFASLMTFIINESYPYLHAQIGLPYIVLIFSISSFLGSLFVYFYLPETRNLTLQEIEEYFNGCRATLVSQRQVISAQLRSNSQNLSRTQTTTSRNLPKTKSPSSIRDNNSTTSFYRKETKNRNPEDSEKI